MMTNDDETFEDDIESKEIFQDVYENGQDAELTRLTEMVRKHYLNYLEKQLQENLLLYNNKKNWIHKEDYNEMCQRSIKKTAELLEDKAVKACMIAKFYQRAMVKIIAIVRRTTEEKRLLIHLEKFIKTQDFNNPITCSKETQTSAELSEAQISNENNKCIKTPVADPSTSNKDKKIITLDEKIENFKRRLQKEKLIDVVQKHSSSKKEKKPKTDCNHKNNFNFHRKDSSHCDDRQAVLQQQSCFFPTSLTATGISTTKNIMNEPTLTENKNSNQIENENSNDSVALELARLFSEEKTELDEIFGIDPNEEPDDPQICKILKEIEQSSIVDPKTSPKAAIENHHEDSPSERLREPKSLKSIDSSKSIVLSKSIWPCELFMQRRKLSESLARLIEEDLRWHDIMKWKFYDLFGDDSDDEFTPCSPSIELNEVLIGSCIRRISPWVVKYLMKPMEDGLIGNRFLFKKLAKNLAYNIIMENQYPDESVIKESVENYFCLHQVVMSLQDIDESITNIL